MLDPRHFEIVAGQTVVDGLRQARQQTVRPSSDRLGCFDSADLITQQCREAAAGIVGVEICVFSSGCSVRYDSGLQGFGLLASAKRGNIDGTYEDAARWASAWQAQEPTKRYVWVRKADIAA